jgi:hypothetical protein
MKRMPATLCVTFPTCARTVTLLYPTIIGVAVPVTMEDLVVKQALQAAMTKHLDARLDAEGKVRALKGKSAGAAEAMAFRLMFELTGDKRYRAKALELMDRELADAGDEVRLAGDQGEEKGGRR